jgi:hypothetical protein
MAIFLIMFAVGGLFMLKASINSLNRKTATMQAATQDLILQELRDQNAFLEEQLTRTMNSK